MNILLLALDVDLARARGDSIHTSELARFLAARGHLVDLVTSTHADAAPDLGPTVHHHRHPGGGNLRTVRACTRMAERSQSDVVYERRLSPKISFGVSRLAGIPFVVEVNGTEEEAAMQRRPRASPWRPVKASFRRGMYRKAARVVAVSEGLASYIASRAGLDRGRVVVVPNGVDPGQFAPMDSARAQANSGLPAARWIVFVGNLVPWQGIETALDSMPRILEELPDARLAIVGDGMLQDSLRERATKLGVDRAVVMTGAVPYSDVPSYIGSATLCVAPFTQARNAMIGLSPLKVYEYMACARPVVATAIPGVAELIANSGGGLTVRPGDLGAFADAVTRVLSHAEEARGMGERGRRFVLAQCTWEATAARVERVLQDATLAG